MPELSVVIPTYNRRDRLGRVLDALERQSTPAENFEVVVVDDGSTDGTSEWLSTRVTAFALKRLRLQNGGPARARNEGIRAASGDIVLFVDDDVEPAPCLIAEHLRGHAAEAGNAVLMGPLASLPHYSQPWVAWEQAKVEAQYAAMERGDWAPSFRQFWTGNASVARRHLLDAGLFDPSYLRAEDIELGLRLSERGLVFRFNPQARGFHHAERSLQSWEAMHASYGRNDVAIFAKLGETALLEMLSGNWERLNPAIRYVVRHCLHRPWRQSVICTVLRRELELAERVGVATLSQQVCSVLASLRYWQASAEALGEARAAVVFGTKGR
jgi:glycosyltransferase involved in cell wall biosynthesis